MIRQRGSTIERFDIPVDFCAFLKVHDGQNFTQGPIGLLDALFGCYSFYDSFASVYLIFIFTSN